MRFRRVPLVVWVLAGVLGAHSDAVADVGFDPAATYRVPVDQAPVLGPTDAAVTVVEFSDFYCRFCGRVATTLADVRRVYGGRVRMVYRHNLLSPEDGTLAAEASMAAAAQGKFWPMHDAMFASAERLTRPAMELLAQQLGLDMPRFRADLDSRAHLQQIREDQALGNRLGITGTPTLFVNGRPIVGAESLGVFIKVIDEELARADKRIAEGMEPADLYPSIMKSALPAAAELPPGADAIRLSLDGKKVYPIGLGLPSHRRGDEGALITLVEFSDFECGYCRRSRATIARLRSELGDSLRLVFRHKPLTSGSQTKLVAEAAVEAGEQGKFWEFHDLAFSHRGHIRRVDLERFARIAGLDEAAFRAALDERKHLHTVVKDAAVGMSYGIRGTPTFFFNGTPVIGAVPYEVMRQIADEKKAEATALIKAGVQAPVYDEIRRRARGPSAGN